MEISNIDRTLLLELAAMVRQPYDADDLRDAADRGADLADAVMSILGNKDQRSTF